MKQGGSTVADRGFTVVETMIVLAVTGVLFVAAVVLISGRQNRTQFDTAINALQQQMQQIINETASGFYPQTTAFTCARGVSKPPTLTAAAAGDHQGQNPDCIFLGKAVQFSVAGTDPEYYEVYPLIGNRLDTTGGVEASTLYGSTGTYPEAAAPGSTAGTNLGLTGINTAAALQQGLNTVSMWFNGNPGNTTGTMAFVTSLPSPDGTGVASGSQHLMLYTVSGTALDQSTATVADYIYPGIHTAQPLVAVSSVSVCVASGTTNQSALLTVGQNDASASTSLSVSLDTKNGLTC